MPKSSKTSGKVNAEPKVSDEIHKDWLNEYEEQYQLLSKLKSSLMKATEELRPDACYRHFFTEMVKLKESFGGDYCSVAKKLRSPESFLSNAINLDEILVQCQEYQTEIATYAKSIFNDQTSKSLLEQIKDHKDLFPFESSFLLIAEDDDIFKPEFIAYLFYVCHKYSEFLNQKVEDYFPDKKETLFAIVEEFTAKKNNKGISLQALMIVLKYSGYLDALGSHKNCGYDKIDLLFGKAYHIKQDSVRRIRRALDSRDEEDKNNPYTKKNLEEAVELLAELKFNEEAIKLEKKYEHLF